MTRSLALTLAALCALSAAPAEAQRFRRPFTNDVRISAGFDNNGGAGGCVDYACGGLCYDTHTGTDFALGVGSEVRAAQDGTVSATFNGCANYGYRGNPCGGRCGNYVQIRHDDGATTIYCHMQLNSHRVSNGQRVSCGQVIGQSASSGSSTGPHLHFGYRPSGGSSQEVHSGGCGRGSSLWVQQGAYGRSPAALCSNCSNGATRGCGSSTGACQRGTERCSGGQWGSCQGAVGPRAEACNGADDDCDGAADEALRRTCGTDVGECSTGEERCGGGAWGECVGSVAPTLEVCDRLDNDCDGSTDEDDVCEVEELLMHAGLGGDTDIDGDGRSDVCGWGASGLECHLASGHGFEREVLGPRLSDGELEHPSRYSTLRMGDIDGDGRADACVRTETGMRCWRSSGAGFGVELAGPALTDADGFREAPRYTSVRMADLDGDGRQDLCARWPDGLRCARATGRGFEERWHLAALADDQGFEAIEHYGTLRFGDIDGDGRADVCARRAEGVECWRATAAGFDGATLGPAWSDAEGWGALDLWSTLRLADVDGDGRADLCARTPRGYECHPATARGFGPAWLGPRLAASEGWDQPARFATLRLGDVDGDGRLDLCGLDGEGVRCWLFTGRGFDRSIAGPRLAAADGWSSPSWFRTLRLADVDGDGRADVCARDDGGVRCWPSDGRSFPIELPGPPWTAGWEAPARFSSIRVAGHAALRRGAFAVERDATEVPPSDGAPPAGGCAVPTPSDRPAPRPLLVLPLAALWFARRRRSPLPSGRISR